MSARGIAIVVGAVVCVVVFLISLLFRGAKRFLEDPHNWPGGVAEADDDETADTL